MATATVDGLAIAYELIGDGRPWAITPGGRFSMDSPGVRELAEALAAGGNRVLIWDRPNTGASDVCFTGPSESAMQADVLAALLSQLDLAPAVIAGGSGGSRVSLLTATCDSEVAAAVAAWWISGGVYGLMVLGTHYCGGSIRAAWTGGMEAVTATPEWAEVIERNPANRQRFLDQDPREFIATLERWDGRLLPVRRRAGPGPARRRRPPPRHPGPGVPQRDQRRQPHPRHLRAGRRPAPPVAAGRPPWGDEEWNDRSAARPGGAGDGLFVRWPRLAPTLLAWAGEVLGN